MIPTVILKPLINEKSMALTKDHLYTFAVSKQANKKLISQAVAKMFNVEVLSVKTINLKPKRRWQRTRRVSRDYLTAPIKKAIVEVKKSQKIAVFEQATEPETEVTEAKEAPVKEKRSLLKGTKVKIEASNMDQESSSRKQREKEISKRELRTGRSSNVTKSTEGGRAGSSK